MTLRPIKPIDVRGLAPRVPITGAPIFEWVDPRTLMVDPAYQRNLSERSFRQIRRIVEGYDWPKFTPPVCAYSEDDEGRTVLKIIDGQHTAIAAASNPHVDTIPVMIVEAPDVRSQASAFIGQNTDRLGVTATQMHIAALAAGDEDAKAMAEVCRRAGVNVRKNPPSNGGSYEPGDTVAVAAIAALLKKEGHDHTFAVLTVLATAQLAPIKADHVKAVDALFSDPQYGAIDPDALPALIQAQGELAMKEAKTFAAVHSQPLWKALAATWFQKAKKRKGPAATRVHGTPDTDDDLVADKREARGAWSPGNHVRRCVKCDARFRGGRLAQECADCAYGGVDG